MHSSHRRAARRLPEAGSAPTRPGRWQPETRHGLACYRRYTIAAKGIWQNRPRVASGADARFRPRGIPRAIPGGLGEPPGGKSPKLPAGDAPDSPRSRQCCAAGSSRTFPVIRTVGERIFTLLRMIVCVRHWAGRWVTSDHQVHPTGGSINARGDCGWDPSLARAKRSGRPAHKVWLAFARSSRTTAQRTQGRR